MLMSMTIDSCYFGYSGYFSQSVMESMPTTRISFTSWKRRFTRFEPMKPAAPVTRTVLPSRVTLFCNIMVYDVHLLTC